MEKLHVTVVLIFMLLGWRDLANALRCHQCAVAKCGTSEELVECSEKVVNNLYQRMLPMANLFAQSTTYGMYSCFKVTLSNGNRTAMVKGCTYRESNICTGWNAGITVEECILCNASDYCNGFESVMGSNGSEPRVRTGWSRMTVTTIGVAVLFAIQNRLVLSQFTLR
ncbi:uncharacterized protein LOC134225304 [Armigeres subalbatus]|uniref:uncharacterized protein LOC134225304 n=1 Tax=Armigeres subalbatus TaxID=124917 RepID=UPI002ED4DB72